MARTLAIQGWKRPSSTGRRHTVSEHSRAARPDIQLHRVLTEHHFPFHPAFRLERLKLYLVQKHVPGLLRGR